ncbi:MAG: Trm112 family protein [Pirellulales bacterium]
MISRQLLDVLVCPETHARLDLAEQSLIDRINQRIEAGEIINRGGEAVTGPIHAGLVREDGRVLYPVIDDIPIMLIDESIELGAEDGQRES